MLYASKRELHAGLARDILQVRERELQFYTTNINNIGLQASLLAGFAFSTLASHESSAVLTFLDSDTPFVLIPTQMTAEQQMMVLLELFYLTSTISAMGSTLYTLYICLISTILGPGLALRGPEGSVDRAVLGLARVNRSVIQSFAFALYLFQFSILVNSFLNFHVIAACVCTVFVIYYMVTIMRYGNRLTADFQIDPNGIVTGRFEQDLASKPGSLTSAEAQLFPSSVKDGIKETVKPQVARRHLEDYDVEVHKPSNVASSMMYHWQGPLPEAVPEELQVEDEPPPEQPEGTGIGPWFASLFGSDSAKPANTAQVGQEEGIRTPSVSDSSHSHSHSGNSAAATAAATAAPTPTTYPPTSSQPHLPSLQHLEGAPVPSSTPPTVVSVAAPGASVAPAQPATEPPTPQSSYAGSNADTSNHLRQGAQQAEDKAQARGTPPPPPPPSTSLSRFANRRFNI